MDGPGGARLSTDSVATPQGDVSLAPQSTLEAGTERSTDGRWGTPGRVGAAWMIGVIVLVLAVGCAGGEAGAVPSPSPDVPAQSPVLAETTGGAPAAGEAPRVTTLDAAEAQAVAAVVGWLDVYNRADPAVLDAFADRRVGYYDCDYSRGTVVAVATPSMAEPRQALLTWFRARFAEHDQFQLRSMTVLANANGVTLGLDFARRTSDTILAGGFLQGITPPERAKLVVRRDAGEASVARITAATLASPGQCASPRA